MNLNFNVTMDYENPKFQEFLFNDKGFEYTIEPTLDSNFINIEIDRILNKFSENDEENSAIDEVLFLIKEKWGVYQDTSLKSVNHVIVVYKQKIEIQLEHWLSFATEAQENFKAECRILFKDYKYSVHGGDIQRYINDNLTSGFDQNLFSIDTAVKIHKIGQKFEFNTKQRDALLSLYSRNGQSSNIDLLGDWSLWRWAEDTGIYLKQIPPDMLELESSPTETTEIRVLNQGETPNQGADAAMNEILSVIVPTECGVMTPRKYKLLTLGQWPEFKIEWMKKRIKIGCCKVTISYPVLKIRISELNFYIYFSLPKNAGNTLFKIAETCAIRSALGAAVIGAVLGNPAAALASFNALFKACIENEIKKCINSGILTLKEAGAWS